MSLPTQAHPRARDSLTPPRTFDVSVEGLRGVAAILVALSHALGLAILDPGWHPGPPLRFLEAGHAAVLIFFMLSGYVIGLTNSAPFSPGRCRDYLGRRALRLFPIYVVAWSLTLLISHGAPLRDAVGNLLFLQNIDPCSGFVLEPLPMNQPSWSLHYEAVYYLAFILLWRIRPPLCVHLPVALAVGVAGWLIPGFPVFLSGYACGWLFWSLGWWLSQQPVTAPDSTARGPVLSGLLLLLAAHHFSAGQILLNGLGLTPPSPAGMVNLSNLALLPACLLCLVATTRRRVPAQRWLTITAFTIPLATLVLLLGLGRLTENPRWLVAAAFTVAACVCYPIRSTRWLAQLAPFGSISYGFYMIHFPLLFLVQRLPLPTGTPASFALRALLWAALTIATATLLERKLQPAIRRLFLPSPATA